jgi:hypothetical protein
VNVPALYALLQRVHDVFERVAAITEKESNEHLLPTRFLMARAHAAWLAAVRLGMSGQVVETYPLVRMVVENSWYASGPQAQAAGLVVGRRTTERGTCLPRGRP